MPENVIIPLSDEIRAFLRPEPGESFDIPPEDIIATGKDADMLVDMTSFYSGANPPVPQGITGIGPVVENLRILNVDMDVLNGDVTSNVTRQAFLDAWGLFYKDWKTFFANHGTFTDVLLKGRAATESSAKSYRDRLAVWLDALKREAPNAKLVLTDAPELDDEPFWTTGRKLWVIGLSLSVVGAVYAYYVVQHARKDIRRAKHIGRAILPAVAHVHPALAAASYVDKTGGYNDGHE